jgi:hypothetical protein
MLYNRVTILQMECIFYYKLEKINTDIFGLAIRMANNNAFILNMI